MDQIDIPIVVRNMIISRLRMREGEDQEPDPSFDNTIQNIEACARQIEDVLTPLRNIELGLPPLQDSFSECHKTLETALRKMKALAENARDFASADEWVNEWKVYIDSCGQNRGVMGECVLCTETTRVTRSICSNGHQYCTECILKQYWFSTEELTKSSGKCPACRKEFSVSDLFVTNK
jgi:hypothetical protein